MSEPRQGPLRVLVVDDCSDTRHSYCLLLRLWGYEAFEAAEGAEALRLAADCRPDVVLLDLLLPDLNGVEVARRLREQAGEFPPRLVAMTGSARPDSQASALAAGFDRFFLKPILPDQLLDLLREAETRVEHLIEIIG